MHAAESPTDAIVRECNEELGFGPEAGTLKLVRTGVWETHRLGFTFHIYCAHIEPISPKISALEIIEARWIKIADLNHRTTSAEILKAIGNMPL